MDPPRRGCLRAIDARKRGDTTKTAEAWRVGGEDFGASISSVAVHEGLVYATELDGYLHCLELETGKRAAKQDLKAGIWGAPLVADGKVYVQTADGDIYVYSASRELKLLAKNSLPEIGNGNPVAAGGTLYFTGGEAGSKLYAIAEGTR